MSVSHHRRLIGLAAAAVVVVSSLSATAPSQAAGLASPGELAPTDGAEVSTHTPVLSWARVAGAATYEVLIDDNSDFSSPTSATTVNRRFTPLTALPDGPAFWKVRAKAGSQSSGWSEGSFTISQVAGPTDLSPADGTVLQQPEDPPVLSWTAVPGAQSYTVEVDRDQNFLTKKTYTTMSTSIVVPDQAHDGTYFWHVRAQLGSGIHTANSEDSSYQIGPLRQVQNAQPDEVTEPQTDVELTWDPVPGAVSYELWISSDPDFNNTSATVYKGTIFSTRYSPPTTFGNNQYYWKVRAINADNETIEWNAIETHHLFRVWDSAPELLHPADGINPPTSDDLYFQWSPVDHASYYEFQLGTDPNFSPNTYRTCKTAATTFTPAYVKNPIEACMPAQGATHYWRVRAVDDPKSPGGVFGIFSPTQRFIYETPRVQQLAPANGATVAVPTLRWAAAHNAAKYAVTVKGTGGGNMSVTTASLSWTPNLKPSFSPFTWTVQAINANGDYSPLPLTPRVFSVDGEPATTGAAPLTPLTGTEDDPATARFPNLTWEPMPDAEYYRIKIGTHNSNFWDVASKDPTILGATFNYPAATSNGEGYLAAGDYDWQVEAYNDNDELIGASPIATFAIKDLPAPTGLRIALTGTSLDADAACSLSLSDPTPAQCVDVPSTPVLDWDPVPEAGAYMVYLAEDRSLTNMVFGSASTPLSIPVTTNTRWIPTKIANPSQLPDNSAGTAYYWYVRACKTLARCGTDPVSTFNIAKHAFRKVSPKPELLSPANGASRPDDIRFEWRDYLATNTDSVYAPTGESSQQAARQYRIQVSTKSDFTSLVDDKTVDQTRYTPFDRTYPEGQLYWRVQAIDDARNGLAWSDTGSVVKSSPVVELVSPVADEQLSGNTTFRWSPTLYARNYKVELYRNNDLTFSPANRVFSVTTKQIAYAHNKPIPASATPYVWRVQRIDAKNLPGNWSQTGRFYSVGLAPNQVAPSPGTLVPGNDSFFAWEAVQGAAKYKLEYRLKSAGSASSVTTVGQSVALTRNLTDGVYTWRVTAIDAGGAGLGTSPWLEFSVDGTAPKVTTTKPAKNATKVKRTANIVITFSEPVSNVTKGTVKLYRKGSATPVKVKVTLNAAKTKATVNPTPTLKKNTKYTVKLSSSIRDRSGLNLTATSWSFTTKK